MLSNLGSVAKIVLCFFSAILVVMPTAFGALVSSDPTLLRERFPKLSASYEMRCGDESSKISINIKIYLFETYSLKALERLRQAQFDKKGKVDLSDLKRDDLSTTPYYLTAQMVKGNKTVVFGDGKSVSEGIFGVFATRRALYVAIKIPEDYAVSCLKGSQVVRDTTGQDVLTKVKNIGENCLKVWGTVIFEVNVTKDDNKSLTGTLIPDIAGERAGLMVTGLLGVYGIPDADDSAPRKCDKPKD